MNSQFAIGSQEQRWNKWASPTWQRQGRLTLL
jgi:hypothetical protein